MADAVERMSSLTPVGSVLRTAEWAEVPLELRDTAYFSAGVESARLLSAQKRMLEDALSLVKQDFGRGERGIDREMFVRSIRKIGQDLGVVPADPAHEGTLQDPISRRRLELIHRMQTERAQSYAQWKSGQSRNVLDRWPAQELIRMVNAKNPRDWASRWRSAGGKIYAGGRMIARKDSPIWAAISRFGSPIPPYDFNSGMDVIEIDRDEAIALGVIGADDVVEPLPAHLTENLQAGAAGIDEDVYGAMRDVFNVPGDVQIDKTADGRIVWNRVRNTPESRDDLQHDYKAAAGSLFSRSREAFQATRSFDRGASLSPEIQDAIEASWAAESTAAALGRKPLFHEDLGDPGIASEVAAKLTTAFADTRARVRVDGNEIFVWDPRRNPKSFEKIRERAHSGRELGYGVEALVGDRDVAKVHVDILNAEKEEVGGFTAPLEFGGIFGAARAKDFRDATGEPHFYRLRRIGQ